MGTYLCVCVLGVYNVAIYVYVVVHNYVNLITSTKKREGRERECVYVCVLGCTMWQFTYMSLYTIT